jgi:hypothetical protein
LNAGQDLADAADTSVEPALRAEEEKSIAEVLRKACVTVGAIVDGETSLQTQAVDDGAIEAIMAAMEWFPLHGPLQQWACYALFNLSFDHIPNKIYIVKQGSLSPVLNAMNAHPQALELNRHAVGVLFNVLRNDKAVDTFTMRQVALNAGLVEVLTWHLLL